jgi:hypothetical protein
VASDALGWPSSYEIDSAFDRAFSEEAYSTLPAARSNWRPTIAPADGSAHDRSFAADAVGYGWVIEVKPLAGPFFLRLGLRAS